jgi:hypothetical protein
MKLPHRIVFAVGGLLALVLAPTSAPAAKIGPMPDPGTPRVNGAYVSFTCGIGCGGLYRITKAGPVAVPGAGHVETMWFVMDADGNHEGFDLCESHDPGGRDTRAFVAADETATWKWGTRKDPYANAVTWSTNSADGNSAASVTIPMGSDDCPSFELPKGAWTVGDGYQGYGYCGLGTANPTRCPDFNPTGAPPIVEGQVG